MSHGAIWQRTHYQVSEMHDGNIGDIVYSGRSFKEAKVAYDTIDGSALLEKIVDSGNGRACGTEFFDICEK